MKNIEKEKGLNNMVTHRLKRIILKITSERLKKKRNTEKQSKEKVAPVLLEDMNEIIKKTGTF